MSRQVKELGLGDYIGLLGRRWRWLVGTFVVGVGLVAAFTFTRDEVYQSRADVFLLTEQSAGQFPFEPSVEERLTRNSLAELQLMFGRQYLTETTDLLGYEPNLSYSLIAPPEAEKLIESSVIRIVSKESSPQRAQLSAQAFSNVFIEARTADDVRNLTKGRELATELRDDLSARRLEIRKPILELRERRSTTDDPALLAEINAELDQLETDSNATITSLNQQIGAVNADLVEFDQALASLEDGTSATRALNDAFQPLNPISPDVPRNMLFGGVAALLLGLLLAALRELLDSSASDASELATLADAPIIAAVPPLKRNRSAPGGTTPFAELPSEQVDPYRALLDSVWLSGNGKRVKSVAVTAVRTGSGSTQTAVNMAQAQAGGGSAVCLVDADFANPSVLTRLGIWNEGSGLADLLSERCVLDDAITPTSTPGLDVIGAGLVDRWTPDYLRSQRLGDLLQVIGERYSLVIVDTSSITGLSDSRTVAAHCDGVVVVYDESASRRDDVVTAVEVLRSAHARPVGLVANRSDARRQVHLADSST